ncbi:hypothetical protein VE03_03865 [Pseudogymnoascus sp. 23342-1-I1]|nr:hypothetical protein VE03_03865 [Pseudogymnoascus sp. 23342-1-I1]
MAPPSAIDIRGLTDTEALIYPDPLTVNEVTERRAKAGKLIAGVAAGTSSDNFKGKTHGKLAKRFDHLISEESKSRGLSSLKGAAKFLSTPGIISLGGGLPCSEYFPFQDISMTVPVAPDFSEEGTAKSGVVVKTGKYDATRGDGTYDLSICLNYGQGTGSAQLLRFVVEHTEITHSPPYKDWQCAMSIGSTMSLEQAYRIFTERGDYILSEQYTFASAVETALPLGCKFLGIKMDSEGLMPEDMDDILSNWDVKARGARKPHLLYTVPTGQNPSGATQSVERRKALYKVCQKHDVFIIEDEPYYFLQMQPYTGTDAPPAAPPANNEEFLRQLVPSLLSLDTDGRVMRLDSFSKVIAPGTRTGWITASAQIVERFVRHNEVSAQNPSGLSAITLYKLLDETWGHDGYLEWLRHLRVEYTGRRDALLAACEKFLPKDIITWTPPAAGMFLWLEVNLANHPDAKTKSILEIEDEMFLACVEKGVLLSKGSWFLGDKTKAPTQLFLRATFAAATAEKMEQAIERVGVAVRDAFAVKE